MKIAHIVNPVNVTEKSDLFIAQPVTFETMRRAKQFATLSNDLEVELYFTCYEEDLAIKPLGFNETKLLEKSILSYKNFDKKRKLPLIKDILDRLYESSDADYFIYTNVDIAVMPHFYTEVNSIINNGYDGFVINRRTIDEKYTSIDEIPQMYSDIGEKHPGYDCFVFRRDAYPHYDPSTACIGANWIGRVLISNLILHSKKFKLFKHKHLTFHIGDDRSWKTKDYQGYDRNNELALIDMLKKKATNSEFYKKPLLQDFFYFHDKKLATSLYEQAIVKEHTFSHKDISIDRVFASSYLASAEWKSEFLLTQSPIFIVGYPRSGTTLLQVLLATQKEIISLPEVHFFSIILRDLVIENDIVQPSCLNLAIKNIRLRINLSTQAENHIRSLAGNHQLSPKVFYEIIIIDNLIQHNDIDTIKSSIWLEKTPDNALHLDQIFAYYPNAKIIHILRNPEKSILSRRKYFNGEKSWNINRHVTKWLNTIHNIEKFTNLYPEQIISLKLEDLVSNKTNIMKDLCEFIGIEFDDQKMQTYKAIAQNYYMPWETWKQDTKSDISTTISNKKNEKLSESDKKAMYNIAFKELEKYSYHNKEFIKYFNNDKHINQLMRSLKELSSISFKYNPFKKLKACKQVLNNYYLTKTLFRD